MQGFQLADMISIHALREEGDVGLSSRCQEAFQISIHALREEGDVAAWNRGGWPENFYPRPPRGGRRSWMM